MNGTGAGTANLGYPPPAILVSACLLGMQCNHRGEANTSDAAVRLSEDHTIIPVCPESAGGLPTPRAASQRTRDGRVVAADGSDVTASYERGARIAVDLARESGAREAVLKARSPSCGCHQIYVDDQLVDGEGVTAQALHEAGVEVRSEEDL